MLRRAAPVAALVATAAVTAAASTPATPACSGPASAASPGCPAFAAPASPPPAAAPAPSGPSYDVYGRRIDGGAAAGGTGCPEVDAVLRGSAGALDGRNQMPAEPAQRPAAGQRAPLPTERAASSIPKGGSGGTWSYPSPQMFYNALKRKGKGGDVTEADMDSVVAAHNGMNEATWQRVAAWEAMHARACPAGPRLLRFRGRPHDLSPAARLAAWAGGPMPFDRHDWVVDRCGQEVRYVIDFYFDDAAAGTPAAFSLRVRPALDGPSALYDRVKMGVYRVAAAAGAPCPVTGERGGGLASAACGRGGGSG